MSNVRAMILAAGKGTRMKSARPKVMHDVCGRPMLWHVLRAVRDAGIRDATLVVNRELEDPAARVARDAGHKHVRCIVQEPQRGTGHAVQLGLGGLDPCNGTIVVLYADMPLLESALIERLVACRGGSLALVTAHMPPPCNFGRVIRCNDGVERVVEERDATEAELAITEMNCGLYAFDETKLRAVIGQLRTGNAQGEYYLTDTVGLLAAQGEHIVPVVADDYTTVLGVNDRIQLAAARARLGMRFCERHMRAGVTIIDPATTYLEPDLTISPDVAIHPNTTIADGSTIGAGAVIGPNAHLSNARVGSSAVVRDSVIADSTIGDRARIGPWAHLHEGTVVEKGVVVGNFVEAKNALIGSTPSSYRLSYIDAYGSARA